jgi:hypothetical protein
VSALESEVRSYIAEPDRGRRKWAGKRAEQAVVYANRQRIGRHRGKQLLRRRGELVERTFAHAYETGALRRLHVRGKQNVQKRLLLQAAGCNLALLLRKMMGAGTPRALQDVAGTPIFHSFTTPLDYQRDLCASALIASLHVAPDAASYSMCWRKFDALNRRFRHGC